MFLFLAFFYTEPSEARVGSQPNRPAKEASSYWAQSFKASLTVLKTVPTLVKSKETERT